MLTPTAKPTISHPAPRQPAQHDPPPQRPAATRLALWMLIILATSFNPTTAIAQTPFGKAKAKPDQQSSFDLYGDPDKRVYDDEDWAEQREQDDQPVDEYGLLEDLISREELQQMVDAGMLGDMQDLRELQRLMEDLEQALAFPEMRGGLPGDESPNVDQLGNGVLGDGTSIEDLLFGRQGPRWDGVGMDVESFGGGTQGNSRYPSAEPGPSGSAAPDITPQQDRDATGKYSYVIATKTSFQRDGQHVCIVTDTYIQSHGPSAVTLSTVYIDGEQYGQHLTFSENGETTFEGGEVVEDIDFPTATPEEADLFLLGELRSEETTLHEYPDDSQPNPEGDGAGGPAGGQREFLDWLTGRPPKAGNQALNRPIGKMDVLGQPGAGEARYRSSSPTRFSRMRYDINPAMRGGETERDDSTWCPPVDPDGTDDRGWMIDPLGPGGPGGPGGSGPVKEGDR